MPTTMKEATPFTDSEQGPDIPVPVPMEGQHRDPDPNQNVNPECPIAIPPVTEMTPALVSNNNVSNGDGTHHLNEIQMARTNENELGAVAVAPPTPAPALPLDMPEPCSDVNVNVNVNVNATNTNALPIPTPVGANLNGNGSINLHDNHEQYRTSVADPVVAAPLSVQAPVPVHEPVSVPLPVPVPVPELAVALESAANSHSHSHSVSVVPPVDYPQMEPVDQQHQVDSQQQAIDEHGHAHGHGLEVPALEGHTEDVDVDVDVDCQVQVQVTERVVEAVEQAVAGTIEQVETVEQVDTLELLKNTPLCRKECPEDFEKKYPAEIDMLPANDAPIETPLATDVLFGRGGLTNHHPGNKMYREIIDYHKPDYQNAAKITKPRVARRIVYALRHSQSAPRFLKRDPTDNMWRDVGDKAASEKTSQALREKSPEEKKASAKAKTNGQQEDISSGGYAMPSLTKDGNFIVTQAGQLGTDPAAGIGMEGNQEGVPVIAENSEAQHPVIAQYPIEGGIFGTVNAEGHIVVTDQDILCGRGGATNHHKGNKRFRDIVALHRPDYVAAQKIKKPDVARKIVKAIRMANPPGRFLKKNDAGLWIDIGDKKAAEKASQALREKGPEARKAKKEAAAQAVAAVEEVEEGLQYTTFPDVGTGDALRFSPPSLHVTKPDGGVVVSAQDGLLPDVSSLLGSATKRSAENLPSSSDIHELEIASPDLKRLKHDEPVDVEV